MKVIKPISNKAFSVISNQEKKDVCYKCIKSIFFVKTDEGYLAFNNITKELLLLNKDEYEYIKFGDFSNIPEKYVFFITKWFLVPIDFNEHNFIDQILLINKSFDQKDYINNFIIFTTTKCNARCFYCFEHGQKRINMSEKTAEDVANYIIDKSKGNKVSIKWFGGEPLCNINAINVISNILNKNGIEFTSRMTTNGYLFDKSLIKQAKNDWHLKRIQITLDGMENSYNQIKNYINSENVNPFKKVIENIKLLLNAEIYVKIRLNITETNIDEMYQLVEFLNSKFSNSDFLSIYANNLFDLDSVWTKEETKNQLDIFYGITNLIHKKNLKNTNFQRWCNLNIGCMAQNKHSVTISPIGELGRCEHFTEGENMYGSIYSDDINKSAYNKWLGVKRTDACYECAFYPNCYGTERCVVMSKNCSDFEKKIDAFNFEYDIKKYYEEYLKKQ